MFARKGEEIRDDAGQLVATFARDVEGQDFISLHNFVFPGDVPEVGDVIPQPITRWIDARRAQLRAQKASHG